jgi:hypothetical protein
MHFIRIIMMGQYNKQIFAWTSWTAVGFYRGVQEYNYKHQTKNDYMYADCFAYGCFGGLVYYVPFAFPYTAYKELKRAEIYIRGLEKTKDYYDLV